MNQEGSRKIPNFQIVESGLGHRYIEVDDMTRRCRHDMNPFEYWLANVILEMREEIKDLKKRKES